MADSELTSLSLVTSNQITDTTSSQFYIVRNGNSQAIDGDMLQARFGTLPGVLLVRSTGFSIDNNVNTPISWDDAEYDLFGMWSSNSVTLVQIPNDEIAYIQFGFAFGWGGNTSGRRTHEFLKNGSPLHPNLRYDAAGTVGISGTTMTMPFVSYPVACNSGDLFEVTALQDSGGTLSSVGSSTYLAAWPVAFR